MSLIPILLTLSFEERSMRRRNRMAKTLMGMALLSANPLWTWAYVFPSSARSCVRGRRMRG